MGRDESIPSRLEEDWKVEALPLGAATTVDAEEEEEEEGAEGVNR